MRRNERRHRFHFLKSRTLPLEPLESRLLLTVSATPIFIDNFNQAAGSLPSTSTWNYDTGEDPNAAVNYVDNSSVMSVVNDPTASDGKALAINIQEGAVVNGTQTFTSARIDTSISSVAGNLEYGLVEASIKLPGGPNGEGNGLWPAFWMLGANFPQVGWPNCGEIDIMENKGTTPGTIQGSLHSGVYSGPRMDPTSYYNLPGGQSFYNSYHLFAVEWSPGCIQFLVDGQVYSTFLESNYSPSVWNFNDHGFYIILNIADGGGFGGPLGANSTFPQTMYVDYVAAYSLTGIGTPTNLTAHPITSTQVNLSWQDPSNDATAYVLQRSTSSTFATINATFNLGQGVSTYQDTSAVAGTPYYYRLQATSSDGTNMYQSGYSNTATTTTWIDQDINTTGGSIAVASDVFTQIGQGAGITGTSDQFNFMNDPWSGDGTLTAKLSTLSNTNAATQAGVMFRNSTASSAAFAAVLDTPSDGIEFVWRSANGGTVTTTKIGAITAPVWLELVRSGNSFSAYYSTNDLTWTQIGTAENVAMNALALIGLAVSSDTTAAATATFTDVSIGPNLPTAVVSLNSGGTAKGNYGADGYYSSGTTTSSTTNAIDTTGVPDPAPQAVYQTNRYATTFTYTVPGLTPGASYDVQLQFAETYFTAAGDRIFNVSINGTNVLSSFDIFAAAGGENKAVQEDFTTTADSSGNVTIVFGATTNNAQVNGIQIIPIVTPVTPNQLYVMQLYTDLLHRTADAGGLAHWSGLLNAGATYQTIALDIASSTEYYDDLVASLYETYLKRAPDPGGLGHWTSLLLGGTSVQSIQVDILSSQEFYSDSGGTAAGYITQLYEDLLGRSPDAGGLAHWEGLVAAPGGAAAVATGLINSSEYESDIISAYYESYLHRAADAGGLQYWLAQLESGVIEQMIVSDFVSSAEYLALDGIT